MTFQSGTPNVLWIELTSKCPFDCVFCSRKLLRGNGQHMEISLFHRILSQLDRPDILRLNYSGESTHHPHLGEAIEAAKASGAKVELVSAFASAPDSVVRDLVDKGLDRLTISLHTTREEDFHEIYGFSSFDSLRRKLRLLRTWQQQTGRNAPEVTFAFVAMDRNLNQLSAVAAFAKECGADELSIHPVLRRDPILVQFPSELESNGAMRSEFAQRVLDAAENAQADRPELRIRIARPGSSPRLRAVRASLVTCEQNPWETIHILSNGDAVPCEVQDKYVLGNIDAQGLRKVWEGAAYRNFRKAYAEGSLEACAACPWQNRHSFEGLSSAVYASNSGGPQFLRGWHGSEMESVVWSRRRSVLVFANPAAAATLRIRGLLPVPGSVLTVCADGRSIGVVTNTATEMESFDLRYPVPKTDGDAVTIGFEINKLLCPAREGVGTDTRDLGFALIEATLTPVPPVTALHSVLHAMDGWTAAARKKWTLRSLPRPELHLKPGISILIPERGNAVLLSDCLDSLQTALARVMEPVEINVIVNGSDREDYAAVSKRHANICLRFHRHAMGFSRAIRCGLTQTHHDWIYLLNNDMTLDSDALTEAMSLRAADVFSIGSQIFMHESGERRVETNFTRMALRDGLLDVWDADPPAYPAASLYSGGGSSFYQTRLLRRMVGRSTAYDPFYFEDLEWGVTAIRHNYRNLFCPASRVRHHRRSTVRKFYEPAEVDRIFLRNRLLFQLRNLHTVDGLAAVFRELGSVDPRIRAEILSPALALTTVAQRFRSGLYPSGEDVLREFQN